MSKPKILREIENIKSTNEEQSKDIDNLEASNTFVDVTLVED